MIGKLASLGGQRHVITVASAFTQVLRFETLFCCSGPLLQHLLAQQGEQIFVAAVAVLQEASDGQEDSEAAGAVPVQIHDIAAAARVLQMSRNTQVTAGLLKLDQHTTTHMCTQAHCCSDIG